MRSKEKQEELDKYLNLLNATLDYLIDKYAGVIIFDDRDFEKEYFEHERNQITKYYGQRRLDRLQFKLTRLTESLYIRKDVDYSDYMVERTGYSVDLYQQFREQISEILERGQITSGSEFLDMQFMQRLCVEKGDSVFDCDLLREMLDAYTEVLREQEERLQMAISIDAADDEIIEERYFVVNDKKVSVEEYEEMRIAQDHLYKINSPNSRNWLELQSNGKKESAITYVAIGLESGSGTVYGVRGERLPIKAYWFNDTTIVIETSKEYEVFIRYHEVTTKNAVYHIRYIES